MAKKETQENEMPEKNHLKDTENLEEREKTSEPEQTQVDEEQNPAEEQIQEQIQQEEQSFEKLKQELDSHKERYIRLMAEFDNYKRRTAREFEKLVESANEKLMVELIDVRENFDRAIAVGQEHTDFTRFFDGMKMIFNKFNDVLTRNGLSAFTEVGDEFNPEIHDAMMNMPHGEIAEGHIAQIYEKGYRLKNHVVKHAKVIVSSGRQDTDKSENTEE